MEQMSLFLYGRDWGRFRSGFRLRCFALTFKSPLCEQVFPSQERTRWYLEGKGDAMHAARAIGTSFRW